MMISNCCGASFPEPGYPDTDLCGKCHEHCDAVESDELDATNEYNYMEYRNDVVNSCLKKYNIYNTTAKPNNPIETIFQMHAKIADLEVQIKGMSEYIDILHEKDIKNKKEDTEVY